MTYDVVKYGGAAGVLIPRSPPRYADLIVEGPLPWVDVRAHGATGNGTTDDTTAIQAALAVAIGGSQPTTLYFPAGDYLVSGSGTELFLVTKALTIRGDGMRSSTIKVAASVGASVDIFRFYPPDFVESYGFAMRDLAIEAVSGTPARHYINCDITETGAETRFVARMVLERLWLGNNGTEPGGRAIEFTDDDLSGNTFFTSVVRDCQIAGGTRWVGGGDSLHFINNVCHGGGCGLEADLVAGAALLTVERNNITSEGGGLWIKKGTHPLIVDNWFEPPAGYTGNVSGNSAYVDIDGAAGSFSAVPVFARNQLTVRTGVTADGLRLHRAIYPRVHDNSFAVVESGSVGYRTTTSCVGLVESGNALTSGAGSLYVHEGAARAHPDKTVYAIVDDFDAGGNSTPDIGRGWSLIAGTATMLDDPGGHPGVVRIATTAASGTVASLHARTTTGAVLLPSAFFDIEFIVRVNQVDANTTVRYGLFAAVGGNPPTNGIYVERLAADTNWFGVCRAAGSETREATGIAMDTNWVVLRIRRVSSTQIGFTVGSSTEVTETLTIPTATLQPTIQIVNTAAADKTHDVDRVSIVVGGLAR